MPSSEPALVFFNPICEDALAELPIDRVTTLGGQLAIADINRLLNENSQNTLEAVVDRRSSLEELLKLLREKSRNSSSGYNPYKKVTKDVEAVLSAVRLWLLPIKGKDRTALLHGASSLAYLRGLVNLRLPGDDQLLKRLRTKAQSLIELLERLAPDEPATAWREALKDARAVLKHTGKIKSLLQDVGDFRQVLLDRRGGF